ncbi:MAG: ankyrin repeat protein [Sediminicola sp.]|jgi:ankyrin repeat protein
MKYNFRLLFLIISIFTTLNLFSQNAIDRYNESKKAFENGEINQCLQLLESCQQILGGSNAKIESLKCQALVMQSDWINAAIAYTNYQRLLPESSKYGEAYSVMLDLQKEIWSELENIEKKKKEELEKEIKEDLTLAKDQGNKQEITYNSKVTKINETNEKELYRVAMASKDKELLSLYKEEMAALGTNAKEITIEIEKQNNPTSFLLGAIKKDDLEEFDYLLSLGANLNLVNQKGESLLHLTIVNDAYKIFEKLIKLSVDVEQVDKEGNTPLIKAIMNNKATFFRQLLQSNANLTNTNSLTLQSPFHYALLYDNVTIGEIIIQNGISPNDHLFVDNEKYTPLYLAVTETKSIRYADFLLKRGALIDKVSEHGTTPLMAAVDNNNLDFVNFLLNNGANVNLQDQYYQTGLHLAVRNNNPEMVLYLIQRGGADKKIKDKFKNTPLATSKGRNKEISKVIKRNKSFIDLSTDYRNKNHENQYLTKVEKVNTKIAIRDGREDRFFYTYAFDSICNYGYSVGTVNNKRLGFYLTVRANEEYFKTSGSNGTVDNKGKVTGGQFTNWGNDWRFINNTRSSVVEALIGINKKIAYPLWIYAGAGISYSQTSWEMDIYDNLGDYYDTDWLKNTDEQYYKPVFESGFIVDLSGFNIRGGVKTEKFKEFTMTLGIGFSISR